MHIKDALEEILAEAQFPKADYPNAKGQIMGLLWRMHADSIEASIPGTAEAAVYVLESIPDEGEEKDDELRSMLDEAQLEWMHAATEAQTWTNHGCAWVDFVFPSLFGVKVQRGEV